MCHHLKVPTRAAVAAALCATTGLATSLGGLLSASPANASAGQSVTSLAGGATATGLAQALVGSGVTISNVTFTGDPHAAGTFSGLGVTGISDGVALSSGSVATENGRTSNILGPNTSDFISNNSNGAGDTDLNLLVSPRTTNDVAVLEFDFVPNTTAITFDYVFGSDEYNEYVATKYNDVFAFYVNGTNCATVGTPPQPVSINTVNGTTNATLFRNNDPSEAGQPSIDTQMDGLTTVLSCQAAVNRNQTNHLKLAIADTGDFVTDSTVLLAAGSLKANNPPVARDDSYPTAATVNIPAPGVLGNDTDTENDPITVDPASVSQPAHGVATVNTDGSFTYTPQAGYTGADSFTYKATDGGPDSNLATVSLTATPVVVTPPDTTAPVTTVTKAPKKRMHKRKAIFKFTSTDPTATFQCQFDDQKFNRCASKVVKNFAPGKHSFTVRAVDAAGNIEATPKTVTWRFVPLRDYTHRHHHNK